jgi:2-iminobutanoate/2-iminopropanoate deaminase
MSGAPWRCNDARSYIRHRVNLSLQKSARNPDLRTRRDTNLDRSRRTDYTKPTDHPSNTMPAKTVITPPKAAPALGPYNHGIRVGDLLFCAGQIPIDPAHPSGPLPEGIRAQTERALENVRIILEDQKLTFAHVVKTTVFLTNLSDFAALNEVYGKYFTSAFPARSTVQVSALPRGAAVEIEVIAHY